MKKLICALLAGLLMLTLCACELDYPYTMYIKPSKLSEETLEVLSLFDDGIQFFDLSVDETVKSFVISVWVYRDGEWNEDGKISGKVDYLSGRIAVGLNQTGYALYTMDESGHTKYSSPSLDTPFEESVATCSVRIDRKTSLTLNKEIPIWFKIGKTSYARGAMDITTDFRTVECNAGIAVTLTVSDEIVE